MEARSTAVDAKRLEKLRLQRLGFPDKAAVKAHFEANPPEIGDLLILAGFQAWLNTYMLVRVVALRPRGVIEVSHPGQWSGVTYYRTGTSTTSPTGQTTLLPYVDAVAKHLEVGRLTDMTDEQLLAMLGSSTRRYIPIRYAEGQRRLR